MANRVTIYLEDEDLLEKVRTYSDYRKISLSRGISELLTVGIGISKMRPKPSEAVLDKFKEIRTLIEGKEKQNDDLLHLLDLLRKIIVDREDKVSEFERVLLVSDLPPLISNQLFSILHGLRSPGTKKGMK